MSQPIISGFHPDPSICRVGDSYVLASSSFEYAPGVPIHRSDDLVSWTLVGNALTRPEQLAPSAGEKRSGIYAPTLRHHDGRYWLITTDTSQPMRGQLLVTAERPEGPWSDPVFVGGGIGIDPDLVWDEDGVCHLSWRSFHPDLNGVAIVAVDPATGELLGQPRLLWEGTGLAHIEGPHLYRIGDWWYLLVAEGGTERGHAVSVARSRTLAGPFEPGPANPILSHRSTDHPVQNTGHADLVELADGSWAVVYLGVRPRGVTPSFHVNGRETFLAGVDWVDGWPVVAEDRFVVPDVDHAFYDDFADAGLHPRWVSPGEAPDGFAEVTSTGLRLDATVPRLGPHQVLTRVRDVEWSADVTLDVTAGSARVLLRLDDDHWYGVTVGGGRAEAVLAVGPAVATVGVTELPDPGAVTVRLRVSLPPWPHPFGASPVPDLVELTLVRPDGTMHTFGEFDGRYLSTEVAGGFTGRLWGVHVLEGQVQVASARYGRLAGPAAP